jgi:hypothetical protein
MSKYIALWVEDSPEEILEFKELAKKKDIELKWFDNATDANRYLEDSIEQLSAAVLDIESYVESGIQNEDESSFFSVSRKLNELKSRNPVKYFAFTGKGEQLKKRERFETNHNCKVFDKQFEPVKAIKYLEQLVQEHEDYAILQKYEKAFAIFDCEPKVLDISLRPKLIQLVKSWDVYALRNSSMLDALIRPISEKILDKLIELKVINPFYMQTHKWNEKSTILSFLSNNYSEEIPEYVARAVHTIFSVCPEGLHSCPLFDSIVKGETPFLLQSLSLELFNVLAWAKPFLEKNCNEETNRNHFKLSEKQKAILKARSQQ